MVELLTLQGIYQFFQKDSRKVDHLMPQTTCILKSASSESLRYAFFSPLKIR